MLRAARGAERSLITDAQLFDVFEGEALGAGRKSLAITVTLQPVEATLTETGAGRLRRKAVVAARTALVKHALADLPVRHDPDALTSPD